MPSRVIQPTQSKRKITRRRNQQIAREKRPIEGDAYYTIAELTSGKSPYWICSASTIFRAMREGDLKANYIGRKPLFRGATIHNWIEGKGGDDGTN